jgi:hypothetical protein
MNKILLALLVSLSFIVGCKIINPVEQTPTYIHIEPFTFSNPDSSFTGSSSHLIPSAWVYAGGQTVGVFDLPCTVPVIMSKTSLISIIPAVTNQGLKSYVIKYPFYENDTTTLYYNPGKIQNWTPHTRYLSGMLKSQYPIVEPFDNGSGFGKLSGDTTMLRDTVKADVFEGTASGLIYLKAPLVMTSENIYNSGFNLPTGANYLELNYKCSLPFQIGVKGSDDLGNNYMEYIAGFNPKAEWNKIYLDLSGFTGTYNTYTKYQIVIRSSLNDYDGKYTEGYVLIDNLKVISR